jgi:hypothetical protein
MDKFKIELTWHNCKTCPPKEAFNPWLVITDGYSVSSFVYYNKYGFPIPEDELHAYWWADISRTVKESKEFKVNANA